MISATKNTGSYHHVNTIPVDIHKEVRADGSILLFSNIPLEPHPYRLTERLKYWATVTPGNIFIGQKKTAGK